MLVLSRQRDETIMIGDEIEITVVDIRGDKIRLGISAPARIAVHRKEVYESIRKENEQAARIAGNDLGELSNDTGHVAPGPKRLRIKAAAVAPFGGGTLRAAGPAKASPHIPAHARAPDTWPMRRAG